MELLSPAGNREALAAAISCGADAVYLGYTAFGARSYAGNFDAEQLREAVEYAAGLLCDGDVLVVAGKGAEKYIERGDRRIKYSDVDEALLLSRGEK